MLVILYYPRVYLVIRHAEFIVEVQSVSQTLQENIGGSNQKIFRGFPKRIHFVSNISNRRVTVQESLVQILKEDIFLKKTLLDNISDVILS